MKNKMDGGRDRRKRREKEGCLLSSRLMRTKVEGGRKRRVQESCIVSSSRLMKTKWRVVGREGRKRGVL